MQQVPPPPPSSTEPAYRQQAGGNPWALASLVLALVPVALFVVLGFVGPSLGTVEVALVGAIFFAEIAAVVTGITGIVRAGRTGRGLAVAIVGLILGTLAALLGFFIFLLAFETGIFAPR